MNDVTLLLLEYARVSKLLTEKQNQLIKCKSKQQAEQLKNDIYILNLLYDDINYKLDLM